MKIAVFTLGCKVNQYDGDAMLAIFAKAGFDVVDGLGFADVYVLNTCAVTAEAEKKSRQSVTRIRAINPAADIYVCGCASQNNAVQFEKDGVKYVGGTDRKTVLAEKIVSVYKDRLNMEAAPDFSISKTFEDNDGVYSVKTRHFIKVQDGCNNFCSYCIVPYLRGRSRSRSVDSIIRELDSVQNDVKEIVVTGINLSAYGEDDGKTLADLMLALSKYDARIRLGSLEVRVITDEFLEATKKIKNFCPHFHLSLQSGDDKVLNDMNRHYTADEYMQAVNLIREYYPVSAITTDIIVGFPTECDENFENSLKFAKKVGFQNIHVFPYSSRKGTVAGKLKILPQTVMDDRVKRMTEVKNELNLAYLSGVLGSEQEVLFESECDGLWSGHTPTYVKVYAKSGGHNEVRLCTPTRLYRDGVICDD